MDRIGPKSLDLAGVVKHLGKTMARPDVARPASGEGHPPGPVDLRSRLLQLFSGVDTADSDAMARLRRGALPLIVRDALGAQATEADLAYAVESLGQLFVSDERLDALLVRAVESARR